MISRIASSTDENASATSRTPTEPAGTAEDDYVVALASIATTPSDGTWTDPADFTEITQKVETLGNQDGHIYLGYKKRAATAGSGYAFSFGGTAGPIRVSLLTLRGCHLTEFLDISYVDGTHYTSGTNNPNGAANAITTVTNNAWVLICQQISQTITGPTGAPSGFTVAADYLTSTGRGHYMCTIPNATADEVIPGVFTHTDSVGTADSRVFTFGIRAASDVGRLGGIDNRFNTFVR